MEQYAVFNCDGRHGPSLKDVLEPLGLRKTPVIRRFTGQGVRVTYRYDSKEEPWNLAWSDRLHTVTVTEIYVKADSYAKAEPARKAIED